MNKTFQPSLKRFYALLLIGTTMVSIGIMFIMLLINSAASSRDFAAVPVQVGFAALELTLTDLSGKSVSLKDHLGSVTLVNLWATWCPPCREEMPTLQSFYEKYKANGFVLIAINQGETVETIEPFVKEFGLTFPVWLDLDNQAQRQFDTVSLPSSYVIDRNGKIRLVWIGGISKKNLEKYVPDLIEE